MKKGNGVLMIRLQSILSELYRYNRRIDIPDDVKVSFGEAIGHLINALDKIRTTTP